MAAKRKAKRAPQRMPVSRLIAPGFHVIGFCDVVDKPRGTGAITYFRKEHVLIVPVLPSREELRAYATKHGYYPSKKIGAAKDICDPVYLHVEGVPCPTANSRSTNSSKTKAASASAKASTPRKR